MGYDYLYKGHVYYRLSNGKFLVNLPNIKKQPDGDQIFNTEDEVKYAIDRALGEPCEYCEPNKDNKCKPMMKCLDKLNGYERIKIHHVRPLATRRTTPVLRPSRLTSFEFLTFWNGQKNTAKAKFLRSQTKTPLISRRSLRPVTHQRQQVKS